MLKIYLLRHGETAWNADGNRYCGRTDLPLTDKGIRQAELVHDKLKDQTFDLVFASPLKRAIETARIVTGKEDIQTDKRLIEIDFGKWEGKSKEVFISENEELWNKWRTDPTEVKAGETGESAGEVVARVDAFFQSIVKKEDDKKILIGGHNGINRLYLSYKLGMPLKNYRKFFLDNASVTEFTLDQEGAIIIKAIK